MSYSNRTRRQALLWIALALAAGSGCQPKNVYQPPPPPTVSVAKPLQKTVTNYLEETGTTEAVQKVDVRARVRGFLERVAFQAGVEVKKGDLLYVIQPREFKAKVDAAKAELDAKKVELEKAKIEYQRQLELRKGNATSETNVVAAKAEQDGALAAVEAAKAKLDQAELDLEYTQVRAPIAGRVGKTLVKVGNLVGEGEATHLTTVIQYDPIYANFNISERALLDLSAAARRDKKKQADYKEIKLFLQQANDQGFPFQGHVDYADLAVDQATGTFLIRGLFPNPDRKILPGGFVRVRLPIGVQKDALLVPERAIGADQKGKYVFVLGGDNKVERHAVTLGPRSDDMVVIREGLGPDELVIIDGLQRARPGAAVTPKRIELAGGKAAAEAGQP